MESKSPEFYRVTGVKRLRYAKPWSLVLALVTGVLVLSLLAISFYHALPALQKFIFGFYFDGSLAYAASEQPFQTKSEADYRPLINLAIMLSIGIAFVWSLAVSLHSRQPDQLKTASDINKILLGFLVGSGKAYLGIP